MLSTLQGFPCGSAGKESACNAGRPRIDPCVGKIPWRRKRLPTPLFWPGEFHGVTKSQTRLSDFHFTSQLYGYNLKSLTYGYARVYTLSNAEYPPRNSCKTSLSHAALQVQAVFQKLVLTGGLQFGLNFWGPELLRVIIKFPLTGDFKDTGFSFGGLRGVLFSSIYVC